MVRPVRAAGDAGRHDLARSQAIIQALANKQLGEVYAQTGMVPAGSTPQQLAAMIKSDSETWTPRIKALGFQPIE
jgi:tripartite-type tricarboxylate transporter receptor subunit TctC